MHLDFASTRRAIGRGLVMIAMLIGVAPAQAQTAGDGKADGDKRVCRSVVATGTIMSKKTCRTRAQWATIDAASERAFENRRNTNTLDRPQGGAGDGTDSFGQRPN